MKFKINLTDLILGVGTVCKSISSRSTLPVLENIYMEYISDNQILMRGNDLELGIEYVLPVEVLESSDNKQILIKASTLNDIISKMRSDDITLTFNDQYQAHIESSQIKFDIFGLNSSEYPDFPVIERDLTFSVKSDILLKLIKHTIFSVSYDETKQFLNGIKIEANNNCCDFISTDGFRLSIQNQQFDTDIPEFSCIVPFKTMNELSKILVQLKSESIEVHLSEKQISFKLGHCTVISRLINGRFPDYKQVLPKNLLFEFSISRQSLLNATDRANIIASHSNHVARFNFSEQDVTLLANNSKMGDYTETVGLKRYAGERDISVSFNIKLLQEVLKIIEQQDVTIQLNSELSPCVIKPVGDTTYTHILMPIRMSDFSPTSQVQSSDSSTDSIEAPVPA